jgi:ATP-dependent helicase/nuclease subunit A
MTNDTPTRTRRAPGTPDSRARDRESRRIVREELLTNLLVEAGAGSGKTQMLAERMAAGVAAGVYRIEHMAAVTFTRKAASELRGRFHLALEKQLREADQHPDPGARALARQRLEDALSNLERFFAGTIHSFCARLLRERPVESGVSPGFTELDEVQDLELRKRTWRDFVTNSRSVGDPDMMALLDAEIRPKDLDAAFATICLHEDVEFPAGNVERPDPKSARHALEKFWKELQRHLPTRIDPATTCPIQQAAREFRGQLDVSRYRLDRPSVIASLLETWDGESTITQKWWAESAAEKKRLRDLINGLHEAFCADTVSPYLSQWRHYVYRLSVTLLTRARAHAARERRRVNALNYGDLLILTARVLRGNPAVRHSLQQKYQHLFVDEFQDTDPIQAEIAFLLAADERSSNRTSASEPTTPDWRTIPLRAGALFVVGDPKQSIYRFRRADIDIYNIVRHRFSDAAVGRVLPLTMNFRSVPALCEWANQVFQTRFPAEPTAHSPRFAALDAREDNTTSGGVFTLTHTGERSEVHDQNADQIARCIRAEVDAGRRTFSDFLILTRKKRARIAPYARALEALNVPIEVSGAGAFGESREVAALVALLRVLADPQDTVTLIGVLRGPLFGISDPELFAFKQSGGWFSIFAKADQDGDQSQPNSSAKGPSPSPGELVRAALAVLQQYHRWTRLLPAGAALERILEHTGYLALSATTPGGVEAGDLLHAVDRVRQVVEEGGSLADAADALEDDADESTEVESLPLEPGRTDVVRVMNLHKAKGLESTVVFLADPNGGFPLRVDEHIERHGPTSRGWFKLVRRSETKPWNGKLLGEHADWPAHERAEQPYRQAEEDRLLYVAATRAREMLVVSRWTGNQTLKAWGVLNNFLANAQELPVSESVTAPSIDALDCSDQAQAASSVARVVVHDHARQPSWSITSVTADAKHIVRTMRTADAAADDPTKVVSGDTPTHRADAGMAWGTLIHGLLEHAMGHQSATRDDLRRLAMWLTVDEPQLRLSIDDATDTVLRVARAEFWHTAQAGEHTEEAPFAVSHGAKEVTTGVVDLLFKSADGWHVRDYKTDVSLDASVYERQLKAYADALDTLQCQVVDAALVHVRDGE